jgi:DNA-binding CsgD family transcriptional regulator
MGFDHFALAFEARPFRDAANSFLVHDYPDEWAKVYNGFDLAGADPVRRACDRALSGFAWCSIERLVPLTRQDRQMLAVGRESGIADGYTVPRHLPGEASGSCTFVVRPRKPLPGTMLFVAEIVGAVALGAAHRISGLGRFVGRPVLSDRQRECLVWTARGKTASEIATILGISEETVIQHLKLARERYDVHSRTSLVLCAMFDGLIGFSDIFRWWGRQRPEAR